MLSSCGVLTVKVSEPPTQSFLLAAHFKYGTILVHYSTVSCTLRVVITTGMPKVKSAKHSIPRDEPMGVSTSSKAANNTNSKVVRNLLTPDTSIGQHFLKNPAVVDAIVNKAYATKHANFSGN